MIKILVIYHSQTGNTKTMAEAVTRGANSVPNVRASMKTASEATLEDLLECHGVAIGSPEYFGYMAGMVKDIVDAGANIIGGCCGTSPAHIEAIKNAVNEL